MATLNLMILALALVPLCLGAASFLSPRVLRAAAAWLIAWSEGVEAFTETRRSAALYWRNELLPAGPPVIEDSVASRLELGVR